MSSDPEDEYELMGQLPTMPSAQYSPSGHVVQPLRSDPGWDLVPLGQNSLWFAQEQKEFMGQMAQGLKPV